MENKDNFAKWEIEEQQLKDLTPVKVRDLIVECFYVAQGGTFRRVKEKINMPHAEKDVIDSVIGAVRMAFKERGADFNHPTKESLSMVIKALGSRAAAWGTPPDIIEHHMAQVRKAIERLE